MNAPVENTGLITPDSLTKIDAWVAKYPDEQRQSAILPALHILQEQNGGWVSRELLDAIGDYLGMPRVRVYEVATFYSMIELEPVGRHMVAVCKNIACMLCGADNIVTYIEDKLGIKLGETTPDGRITLKVEEECLAACAGGPMMAVDGHYHENLTPARVDEILDALE